MTSCFVNALGVVTPFGTGTAAVADGLRHATAHGLKPDSDLLPGRPVWVGRVHAPLPPMPPGFDRFRCRNNRLALLALEEIADPVGAAAARYGRGRIGVVMGTSTGGIDEGEAALRQRLQTGAWAEDFDYRQQEIGALALFVAAALRVDGPAYTVATACSSGAKAIASGYRLLNANLCDAVVVGGVDTLCRLTVAGFASLGLISPGRSNPFSRNRDGINIGEGAAVMLLSREPAPVALLGIGEGADAYHISSPDPSGMGAQMAMTAALAMATLPPGMVSYLNLHGTGTDLNDAMESRAVTATFGPMVPACSSTKGMTGHLLGAAGAVEAAFLWLYAHPDFGGRGLIPPHLWDGAADPALPPLPLVAPGTTAPTGGRRIGLSNSFAFGGNNISVILGEPA